MKVNKHLPTCSKCGGNEIILCSYQCGNVNSLVTLVAEEGTKKPLDWDADTNGEYSGIVFQCCDCHEELGFYDLILGEEVSV